MIKAFLSHSSKDKKSYVREVAKRLSRENIHYDEITFEEGERSLDEILRGLDATELFVLFLSDASLESDWVKREVIEAKARLDANSINKVFPIIIDENITHLDARIPDWLRENYNLKPIIRPVVAARRIHQKLRERSWSKHPQLKKREQIFVGRNDKIEEFEQRIDDFERAKPIAILVSGMTGVGRRTFLHRALCKTNITELSHKPSSIYLDRNVSIEDFILKLNDLAFIDLGTDVLDLATKPLNAKRELIERIMKAARDSRELIYILDDGCLANYKREVSQWFLDIIENFDGFDYPVFCCACRYNVAFKSRSRKDKFHFVELNELNQKERTRLLTKILDIYEVQIPKEDIAKISDLLFGLPDQVMYAADLVMQDNISPFIKKLPLLVQYNSDKAAVIMQNYENDPKAMEFIRLLAQFEVITTDFLFSVVPEAEYLPILEKIASENLCERMGIEGEIVRLSDVIRDYIMRNRLYIKEDFQTKINELVSSTIKEDDIFERDSSEYIFTIKEALKSGQPLDEKYLIPSHYLRCMKDLYFNKQNMDKIISLADTILQKESTIEPGIVQDIRYYLCQALAHKRDRRMLSEVRKIHGDERAFLLGFYYRKIGRHKDALDSLLPIVDAPYVGARSKREIVQVYVQMEEYDKALSYAKNNYEQNRNNQFHTQAYFNCLINTSNATGYRREEILKQLIKNLEDIDSDQSKEMAHIAQALYYAKVDHNKVRAYDAINDCVDKYPDNSYPLMAKCDIAVIYRDEQFLGEGIRQLELQEKRNFFARKTLPKYKAYLLALQGDVEGAGKMVESEISRFPDESRQGIIQKIRMLAESNN